MHGRCLIPFGNILFLFKGAYYLCIIRDTARLRSRFSRPQVGKKPDSPQRYRRKKRHPLLWLSLAVVIAVGAWAAQRVQARQQLESEVNAVSQVYLQNIYVDGIHIGGMTPQQAIDAVVAAVNERQSSWSLRLTYQGTEFASLNYASMGMTTDISEVYSLLREAYALGHTGTTEAKKKDIDALKAQPRQLYTSQSELTDEKISQLLLNIQQVFERVPTDAYLAYFIPITMIHSAFRRKAAACTWILSRCANRLCKWPPTGNRAIWNCSRIFWPPL